MQHITPPTAGTAVSRRVIALLIATTVALIGAAAPAAAAAGPESSAASVPLLRFPLDHDDTVEGVLEANKPVLVDFAPDRLLRCRNQYAGGDAWAIGVEYRVNGGPVRRQPVTQLDENRRQVKVLAVLDLPLDARDLELWFVAGDRTGCVEYDSRNGANYHYTIEQPAIASFRADWSEDLTGQVRKDRALTVRYDPARLPQCRETYNGSPAWNIAALYRFDGGAVRSAPLTDAGGRSVPASIDVPPAAGRVELWFRVTGQRSGCTAYDSDYGHNYRYEAA